MAGLLIGAVALLINLFLEGEGPAPNAPLADVLEYIGARTASLRLGNGLRMALQPLFPVLAVGVYLWIGPGGGGWRLVGLLGMAMLPALAIPANAAGTIAYWRLPELAQQPQLLTLLWSANVVLFYAVFVLWGLGIGAFSLAGRAAGRMPRWLWLLGLLAGASGIGTGACINLMLTSTWAEAIAFAAFLLTPLWILAVSVMLLRARS